ncbi:MAG: YigZ family protein [Clostridia bacterium]|nr:YigZ family protein [Clostridia bacterium]
MKEYVTALEESSGEYVEKHSKFLGFLIPCKSEEEAIAAINAKRKEFWDARHAVYAFILKDGTTRFSDDGEPHGTAGKPVLDILKSSGLKNALIVVVRYFGGILLGTGGLVRAYSAAATAALGACRKTRVTEGDRYSVSVAYGDYDKLMFVLKEAGAQILSADFTDTVDLSFSISSERSDTCLRRIEDAFSSSVLPKNEGKTEIFEKI